MFFRKRKKLNIQKAVYDEDLLQLMKQIKTNWDHQRMLAKIIVDRDDEYIAKTKLAKAKYFYLLKIAKKRNIKNDSGY